MIPERGKGELGKGEGDGYCNKLQLKVPGEDERWCFGWGGSVLGWVGRRWDGCPGQRWRLYPNVSAEAGLKGLTKRMQLPWQNGWVGALGDSNGAGWSGKSHQWTDPGTTLWQEEVWSMLEGWQNTCHIPFRQESVAGDSTVTRGHVSYTSALTSGKQELMLLAGGGGWEWA